MREEVTIFCNRRQDKFVNTNHRVYTVRDIFLFSEFKSASVNGHQIIIGIFVFDDIFFLFSLIPHGQSSKIVVCILTAERCIVSIHTTGYFPVFQGISIHFSFVVVSDKNPFSFPFHTVNCFLEFVFSFYSICDFLNFSVFPISQGIFQSLAISRKDDFGEHFLHFIQNYFHRT